MKKISVLCAICLTALASIAPAQVNPDLISAHTREGLERPRIDPSGTIHSQFLIFDDTHGSGDSGTYNPTDSFGFDIYLTYSGYNSPGLSFWLETETTNNFAGSLSITGFTYGTTFPNVNQTQPNPAPFDITYGISPGYRREDRDLGATVDGGGSDFHALPPGTYFVGHVSFAINGALPGTYVLRSTTVFPDASEVTSYDGTNFDDNYLPASTYTITIVPEPSTFALLAGSTIGVIAMFFRRAFVKKPRA